MKFRPQKRDSREVAKPPPEAVQRVEGGGPWGPTQFDLPEPGGRNRHAILITSLVGALVLLVIIGLWTLAYFELY
ncbi:hypothetical protein Kfla_4904 [Kribbella flavida DSM 17836]|uniref:Uncharacterized protein n=1 Tax=Kribbella flavida (strain DSM 17836 / JCM 10339 / NBRC 14399) TaxID=479435 RepID=D2Q1X4_KRIFD|nr:hypothetical protein [Kribbella flavida]ADB33920.1 hypothetical protein Kfla_4904 [Kribbella flavida DSM 17836]